MPDPKKPPPPLPNPTPSTISISVKASKVNFASPKRPSPSIILPPNSSIHIASFEHEKDSRPPLHKSSRSRRSSVFDRRRIQYSGDWWSSLERHEVRTASKDSLSNLSYIFGGPGSFASLIRHRHRYLTFAVDRVYFTGRAGKARLYALTIAVLAFGFGLPGFSPMGDILPVGYATSILIPISMILINLCIIISVVFIILLLSFREVRVQLKWHDWNTLWHAWACVFAAFSGMAELWGFMLTRNMNCKVNPNVTCDYHKHDYTEISLGQHESPKIELPYKWLHFWSAVLKFVAALIYSACARDYLRNEEGGGHGDLI